MRRSLDLDNCPNKQRTVLTAYLEELEENERKIVDGGAWAMKYCPNHPLTQHLKWERNNMKKSKDFADFFFWDWD